MVERLPQAVPNGRPYRSRGLVLPRGRGPSFEVQIHNGLKHWIGAECPCRATPSAVQGFAGVLHHEEDRRSGFFEAQACLEHELHSPSPSPVGVAARDPCPGPNPVVAQHTEAEAMALAMRAFDDRGLVTPVATSELGGSK